MSRLRLLLWLAFTLLAGCQDSPRLAALPAGSSVLAFGNSITFGTGARPGRGLPEPTGRQSAAGRSITPASPAIPRRPPATGSATNSAQHVRHWSSSKSAAMTS
jgi:hypothetical protein